MYIYMNNQLIFIIIITLIVIYFYVTKKEFFITTTSQSLPVKKCGDRFNYGLNANQVPTNMCPSSCPPSMLSMDCSPPNGCDWICGKDNMFSMDKLDNSEP